MPTGISQAIIYIRAVDVVSSPLTGISAKFANLGSSLAQVGLAMTAAITMPVAAATAASLKAAVILDKSLHQIQSVARMTSPEVAVLRGEIIGLSTDIKRSIDSPNNLAQAYFNIYQRVGNAADAMSLLEDSTRAATAGFSTTLIAAKAIGQIITVYNERVSAASRISDVMFKVIDRGNVLFPDLAQNMGSVIQTAARMGVSFTEVGAAFAQMTLYGLSASEAQTSLNRVLLAFSKPSKRAYDLAKDQGLILATNTIRELGLVGAMKATSKALGNNIDLYSQVFTRQQALRGALILTADGGRKFAETFDYVNDSLGETNRVFGIMTDSLYADIENLKNKFIELALSISTSLIPILNDLMGQARKIGDSFSKLSPQTRDLIVKVALLGAALGPLMIVLGESTAAFGAVVRVIISIGGWISGLIGIVAAVGGAFLVWKTNMMGIGTHLDEIIAKGGKLAAVMGSLIKVFEVLVKDVRWISTFDEGTAKALTFLKVVNNLVKFIGYAMVSVQGLANAFVLLAQVAIADIRGISLALYDMTVIAGSAIAILYESIKLAGALAQGRLKDAAEYITTLTNLRKGRDASVANLKKNYNETMALNRQVGGSFVDLFKQTKTAFTDIASLDLSKYITSQLNVGKLRVALAAAEGLEAVMGRVADMAKAAPIWPTVEDLATLPIAPAWTVYQSQLDDEKTRAKAAFKELRDDFKSKLADMVSAAQGFSIKLADFTSPGFGKGPLAPGANGPFENIYRLQDVAVRGAASPWATSLGMSQEDAKAIVTKFQQGIIDESVKQFINIPGLVAQVQLAQTAKALTDAFVAEVAGQAGVGTRVVSAILGQVSEAGSVTGDITATVPIPATADLANKVVDGITAGINAKGQVGKITAALDTLLGIAIPIIYNNPADFAMYERIGFQIIAGIVAGIDSNKNDLIAKMEEVVQSAIDAANAKLGIHSLSRVFARMGENTITSFAHAVTQTGSLARNAVGTVMGSLSGAPGMSPVTVAVAAGQPRYGVSQRTYISSDVYQLSISDPASAAVTMAIIEDRRQDRLNRFMGA